MRKILDRFLKKENKIERYYFEGDSIRGVTLLAQDYARSKIKYGEEGSCYEKFKMVNFIEEKFPVVSGRRWHISTGSTTPYVQIGWIK